MKFLKKTLFLIGALLFSSNLFAYDSIAIVSPNNYGKNLVQLDAFYNSTISPEKNEISVWSWGLNTGAKIPLVTMSYKDYETYMRWKLQYENSNGEQKIDSNTTYTGETTILKGQLVYGGSKNLGGLAFLAGEVGVLYDFEMDSSGDLTQKISQPGLYLALGINVKLAYRWELGYQFENALYYNDDYIDNIQYRYDNNIILTYRSSSDFYVDYQFKEYKYSTSPSHHWQLGIGLNWAWFD